jgi:hypothetical protein
MIFEGVKVCDKLTNGCCEMHAARDDERLRHFRARSVDWVSRAWLIENYQRGPVRFKYLGQTKAGNIQGKRGVLRGVAGRRRSAHRGMLQPTVDLPLVNPLVLSYRKI